MENKDIKVIVGLGNPGPKFSFNRHNIGFMVVDCLASRYDGSWQESDQLLFCTVRINDHVLYLIKPLTFMNESGKIVPWLKKKGLQPEHILVIHDDLELPFGKIALKDGGSAKGHNGLRSLITFMGETFMRIRCGIGRPAQKEQVANYVLGDFVEGDAPVQRMVEAAANELEQLLGVGQ